MHSYVYTHYEMVFDKVTVDDTAAWAKWAGLRPDQGIVHRYKKVEIQPAHCLGAAIRRPRSPTHTPGAGGGRAFASRIATFQRSVYAADMAVEIHGGKSLLYGCGGSHREA